MAWITTDWAKELNQVKTAAGELVDEKLSPMIKSSIDEAGSELSRVVLEASQRVEENIRILSQEIHNQRQLTKDDIKSLINYTLLRLLFLFLAAGCGFLLYHQLLT
jgi:hypothetical protein